MQHERSKINVFNEFFRERAMALGRNVRSFSLDGQDALAGADYLLSDESRFALVEFKDSEKKIVDEAKKYLRLRLCNALARDSLIRQLHDTCHFIAWEDSGTSITHFNIYRAEVCNCKVFGKSSGLAENDPETRSRVKSRAFVDDFLGDLPTRSIAISDFERYLEWLLSKASGKNARTLEILARDPDSEECATIKFASVRSAYDWLQRRKLRSPRQTTNDP